MTEQYEQSVKMEGPTTPVVIHKHIRRQEVGLLFFFTWAITLVAILFACQMTFAFGLVAITSMEGVLGVRGDGIPPALSISPPPEIGITPLPTEPSSLEIVPIAPTITRIGETVTDTLSITNTEVITP